MASASTPVSRKIPLIQENHYMYSEKLCKKELLEETSRLEQHVSEMSRQLDIFNCQKIEDRSLDASSLWDSLGYSPLVFEANACDKLMKLYFDFSKYDPSDIQIFLQENILMIQATHEDHICKSETNDNNYREINITFPLPSFVKTKTLKAKISEDGLLLIEAKLAKPECIED